MTEMALKVLRNVILVLNNSCESWNRACLCPPTIYTLLIVLLFHNPVNYSGVISNFRPSITRFTRYQHKMKPVKRIEMNDGRTIPILGLGTWQAKKDVARETIRTAIDLGYRHIDCAMVYQNEEDVGAAIREKIADGTVKREEIFIVTKLWNTFHRPDLVIPACKKSLQNLGLDYIDLYLIHWPCAYQEHEEFFPRGPDGKVLLLDNDFVETWHQMEKCVELNLVRSIGLSNFNSQQIDRIVRNAKIKPAVNQVECHPYLNQEKLRKFCKDRGIVVTGYSPLGSPSRPWAKETDLNVLTNPIIKEIAKRMNKTPAQIVLNYLIHLGVIPLPKSSNKQRLLENISIFDFELSEGDKKALDSLSCNFRYCPLSDGKEHKDYPFHAEF